MDQGPKSYWAEFLGTFTLCFIGQGALVLEQLPGEQPGVLGIAVACGLALAVMTSALLATSGAHFNPAITLGFVVTGRQSKTSAITYWISQVLGAVVASFLLRAVVPGEAGDAAHYGAGVVNPLISPVQAVLLEFVLTFILVTVFWGTTVDERAPKIGGLGVGLAALMSVLVGGPLSGALLNPARAFGAALISGTWSHHWIWWVGPLLGAIAASRVYKSVVLRP
ncbi:MAG: aquaporin [Candidatus Eisenbacteria bacterium]